MSSTLNWELDGKDWPNRAASRFVEAGGLRWHVQVVGSGPVLLLLHGTGSSSHSWRDLFKGFVDNFTVVVPDLPGHGFTETPPNERLSLPGMTLALKALMTRLDLEPHFIAGHSAGAAIGIRYTIDTKEKPLGIIGINAALIPFGGLTGQVFPTIAKMLVQNPFVPRFLAWRATDQQAVTRLIDGTGSKLDGVGLELYRKLFASRNHVASTLAMMAHWSLDELIKDMAQLSTPLLLLVGEKDTAVLPADAYKIRRIAPHTKIITVKETGHLSHEERPVAVVGAILDFLKPLNANLNQNDGASESRQRA